MTDETLDICKASDAVLLGAVGGPKWDNVDPSIRPEKALLGLRSGLGLYANLRPAKLFDELSHASPVKDIKDTDILFVRELTGGIYFGKSGEYDSEEVLADGTAEGHVAFDTETYSEGEINRILKIAFDAAMGRGRKVTLVDKANVLTSSRLWRKLFFAMSEEYPAKNFSFDEVTERLSDHFSPIKCTRCQRCVCPNGYEIHILNKQVHNNPNRFYYS